MKRLFVLIICALFLALASAADSRAQSGRKRTAPPRDERAGKSETKDEAKGEAKEEVKDKQQGGTQEQEQDDARPRRARELAMRAVIRAKPNPKYPVGAREYGVRGVVKLRIILGADGRVSDKIEVLEGLPHGVTEEAIKAARQIKFEPARLHDGRLVSQYVIVFYHFNLY
ncbi:MAG TPA: energy transducer TonB [Pyrinomonadaceae bacterium]